MEIICIHFCSSNSCQAYEWEKEDDASFSLKNKTLIFEAIRPADMGIYKCTATNWPGDIETIGTGSINISVECKH